MSSVAVQDSQDLEVPFFKNGEVAANDSGAQSSGAASDSEGVPKTKTSPDIVQDSSDAKAVPLCTSTVELTKQILNTLQKSSIIRPEQDVRSRFWKLFKTESEEFHKDIVEKCGGELDISLIFAGLFSAVSATFATALQSNLAADPNATTQVLLMMVVHSLNSTAFAGQDLILPTFTGPDHTTIWVQSLLYASLGASLFAALTAVLGKEWVSHYARVGESGTIEDRCIDRQRKLIAMRTWKFDMALACIPLLLQASLLLFGIALSAYMWSQQHTVAGVIIAINVIGVIVYGILLLSSLLFADCPYHIPLTDLILAARERLLPLYRVVEDRLQPLSHATKDHLRPLSRAAKNRLRPMFSRISQVVQQSTSLLKRWTYALVGSIQTWLSRLATSRCTEILPCTAIRTSGDSNENPLLASTTPVSTSAAAVKAESQLDAPCVAWLLKTSTDPEALVLSNNEDVTLPNAAEDLPDIRP
ncbi:hypothetical protein EUX98_g3517 [Antrodiella citrinella]|uniref:DUF6535 domain-containing protein n=1 Tax=Antrodiella citrinella TaxID=2447956 RepID=A0A4S4MWB4_9APHY|nr:hypothetical protein EUX98_g3517 [Antrodiella citrinella]